jgi:hypothetical protein
MQPTVAYLSQGRLFLRLPDQPACEIESQFARETEQRQTKTRSIDGWKSRSGVWGQMGMAPPEWSQWDQAGMEGQRRVAVRSVSRGPAPGELMYLLDLESVSGVFKYDLGQKLERRLMHRNDFIARDLACHRGRGTLAVSLAAGDGAASLAFSEDEGRHWNRVTGGDSVDQAPAWVQGEGRKVVFQSAAVGRNAHGLPLGLGPYAIESLDLDGDKEVRTLLEDKERDFLLPRMTLGGTLYFLRRPYKQQGRETLSFGQFLWDVLMLPFRILLTILHIINFFSVMFSGQPLATALGQAQRRGREQQQFLMLWGHMVDTKRALAKAPKDQPAALVPKDWQLVRRDAKGTETVLADSVLAYDLSSGGQVVFTNGSAVFVLDADGRREKLCESTLIESVVCVE